MIGRKLLVKSGKTMDILKIEKIMYGADPNKFVLECTSANTNKYVTVLMTAEQVKSSMM